MAYTKTTTTTYGQRLKNSFGGIVTGIIMFIAGTVILFWNEGRTVKQKRALNETEKVCVEMTDINAADPSFNGKCVHAIGTAMTEEVLVDDYFGASANAVAISRSVEYYQWVEHQSSTTKDKVGGGQETEITYSYSKEWTSRPVDSQAFEDPEYKGIDSVRITIPAASRQAQLVKFGAYRLPSNMLSVFSCNQPMDLSEVKVEGATVSGNVIYYGNNSSNPAVGDVRVTLTKSPASAEVSLIAVPAGDTFTTYTAKNGNGVELIKLGAVSSEAMFSIAQKDNKLMGWILRIIGILLIVFGLKGLFGIVTAILMVLPFLGAINNVATGVVCWALGLGWSFLIIGIAWVSYRPLVGIPLICCALAAIVFLAMRSKKAKDETPVGPPAPQE